MIERPWYIDRLTQLRGTGLVKVLTGMRRAGKSGILRLLEYRLLEEGVDPASILFINLELVESAPLCAQGVLAEHVRAHAAPEGTTYVLIDEAQAAAHIGHAIYDLMETGRFDLYLTGSHSRLVERDLADVMSGRYVEIPVFPLSFAEYHAAHTQAGQLAHDTQLFQRYMTNGGLPHTLLLEDDPYALHEYLDGVYHTVVRRDVTSGLGHEDPLVLDAIVGRLIGGMGSPSSASAVSKELSATGRSCSDDTVARYLGALTNAYAFHRMRRRDLRTGSILKTQEKFFVDDLGLATLFFGAGRLQLSGLLQNVVYLELRRRFKQVHTAKHYSRHICFVAEGPEGREYLQVAPSVLDPQTLARELAPLQAEKDNYPKTLLTLDEVGIASHDGIRQRNLVEWLLAV